MECMKTFVKVIIRSILEDWREETAKTPKEKTEQDNHRLHTNRLKPTLHVQSNGMKENNKEVGSTE